MSTDTLTKTTAFNIEEVRAEFPILKEKINGKPLVYFDNGATSQKPIQVIEAINEYYSTYNSNIHRGVHYLSQKATDAYEAARQKLADFINAPDSKLINFTKGTTEGINLVAHSYAQEFLKPGDEIVISTMEHHSNIVPWQIAAEKTGATLRILPIHDSGEIILEEAAKIINDKTAILAVSYVSNAMGIINPVEELIQMAKKHGAITLLDGAQAVPHLKVDVQKLDCDFFAFSGHKMFGPTGTGVLYGKEDLLNKMTPYQSGGEMIKEVRFEKTTFNELPYKFEAGTPNIAGGIGLAAAVDFMSKSGIENIEAHEQKLLQYALNQLNEIEGFKRYGNSMHSAGLVSFLIDGIHSYDIGVLLDKQGIALRTGHHCCQPLMNRFGIEGTCRASFALYNSEEEIDLFVEALNRAIKMLK
ncbi:MAG: cysteine desulfurase [Chitinophagales bacterium]